MRVRIKQPRCGEAKISIVAIPPSPPCWRKPLVQANQEYRTARKRRKVV